MVTDKDFVAVEQACDLVEAAHRAQAELARFDQEKIDRICEAMVRAALYEARRLGTMAVEETGYGVAADKERKNRSAAEGVWYRYRDLRTVGVISESEGFVEIAAPRGVVAGITPPTEPTSTAVFKALISIKSRNALVLSPHHAATRCTNETVRVLREAAAEEGLPPDALGCTTRVTREGTRALMEHEHTAAVLKTGDGLVCAPYSPAKPAFGAEPGNIPVFVERTANVDKAARDIIGGRCLDNGMACGSEQSVVVDAPLGRALREQLRARGGQFLSAAEAGRLSRVVATRCGRLNPAVIGKSAALIALMAGIRVPPGTRCLIAEVGGVGRDFPLSMQKLSPILAFYVEEGAQQATARCVEVLSYGGLGHTAGIHTRSRRAAVAFGEKMSVSRVVVNTSTTHDALGLSTVLLPSLALRSWSRGTNVALDDVSPLHLMDIKRIAFEPRPVEGITPALIEAAWESEMAA